MKPTTLLPEAEDDTLSVQYHIRASFPDGDLLQFSGKFDIPCAGDPHVCHHSTQHAFNQFVDSMLNEHLKQAFCYKLNKWRAAALAEETKPPANAPAPAQQQMTEAADEHQAAPPTILPWDHLVARAQPREKAA